MRLKDLDSKFNDALSALSEVNADRVILDLGRPSAKVRSAGVYDRPLKLFGNKVIKKIRKHGYSVAELRGLTKAVRNPIAVFKNHPEATNYSILTTIRLNQGNALVAIECGEGSDAEFNIVTTIFGKRDDSIVNWINDGKLRYVDRKKALRYLHFLAPIATATNDTELYNATKIVNTFRNNNKNHNTGNAFNAG